MNTDTINRSGSGARGSARVRSTAVVVGAMVAVVMLIAGCGSSDPTVAHLGASATPTPSSAGSTQQAALAFTECMRKHGITAFPDPGSGGLISINGSSGIDPQSAQFQSAQKACASLLPNGGAPSAAQQQQFEQDALKFSQCMRAHGIASFPDPQFHSGGGISLAIPASVNNKSPQFQAAQKACQSDLPKPPPGGATSGGPGAGSGSGTGVVTGS